MRGGSSSTKTCILLLLLSLLAAAHVTWGRSMLEDEAAAERESEGNAMENLELLDDVVGHVVEAIHTARDENEAEGGPREVTSKLDELEEATERLEDEVEDVIEAEVEGEDPGMELADIEADATDLAEDAKALSGDVIDDVVRSDGNLNLGQDLVEVESEVEKAKRLAKEARKAERRRRRKEKKNKKKGKEGKKRRNKKNKTPRVKNEMKTVQASNSTFLDRMMEDERMQADNGYIGEAVYYGPDEERRGTVGTGVYYEERRGTVGTGVHYGPDEERRGTAGTGVSYGPDEERRGTVGTGVYYGSDEGRGTAGTAVYYDPEKEEYGTVGTAVYYDPDEDDSGRSGSNRYPDIHTGTSIGTGSSSSSWGGYPLYSEKYFDMNPVRNYLRTCNCMEPKTSYKCPLDPQAKEMQRWAGELQTLLSDGCQRQGPDGCCLDDRREVRDLIVRVTQMLKDLKELIESQCSQCSRDCGWTNWGEWGSCSVTCGEGVKTRYRSGDNPPRKGNGRPCTGPSTETTPCYTRNCCVPRNGGWSNWQRWSSCTVSCGSGTRERYRSCDSPTPNECGRNCYGDDRQTEQCNTHMCDPCAWTSWMQWSTCPVSCGQGTVERRRMCESSTNRYCGDTCPGRGQETKICYRDDCCDPIHGGWANWNTWSSCPVTCGGGTIERYRTCTAPRPNACGRDCYGESRQTDRCNTQRCEFCDWTSWMQWTSCPVSCGQGTVERRRRCESSHGNRYCSRGECRGQDQETKTCYRDDCCRPQHGGWSSWDQWSRCSASCDGGNRERTRSCTNPRPNECGDRCRGRRRETERCNTQRCERCTPAEWDSWNPWSSCSATCGDGYKERSRTCQDRPPRYCFGTICRGQRTDQAQCYMGPCPKKCIDPQWGEWGDWSQCPVTCGYATVSRRRYCITPEHRRCYPCQGDERQEKGCGIQEVPSNWDSWDSWTACSATCGPGQQTRSRRCQRNYSACSRDCVGRDYEQRSCNEGNCRQCEKDWSSWSSWSSCTATCGFGSRSRTRQCMTQVNALDCIYRSCSGSNVQSERCTLEPCAEWSSWTPCSATCAGIGRRERSKFDVDEYGRITENISAKEVETCQVSFPPCPGPEWSDWSNWCPCDCDSGIMSRVRKCKSSDTGRQLSLKLCDGDAREEKPCDVRKECPHCTMSCDDKEDGNYPSCTGCSDYIECKDNKAKLFKCNEGKAEWDSFTATCHPPPSPSCLLKEPVTDCKNMLDGSYHSAKGCGKYVTCKDGKKEEKSCNAEYEWNQYNQRCEPLTSLSCIRAVGDLIVNETNVAVVGGEVRPASAQNDAPADMYFDEETGPSREEARLAYEARRRGRRPQPVADEHDRKATEENETLLTPGQLYNPGCIRSCQGKGSGIFPSCEGCDHYIICTVHGRKRERKCTKNRQFDAKEKRCIGISSTCKIYN